MNLVQVALADGFDGEAFEKLSKLSNFSVALNKKKLTPDELNQILPEVNCLVVRSATKVNEDLLSRAQNLKLVIRAGEGVDNIDLASCQKRGVLVSNTPGANNNSAAEHAISLMFSLLRKIPTANLSMQKGEWEKSLFMGEEMTGKKIGIIGFGRIGQLVCKRLAGFDVEVKFYDPFIKESPFSYARPSSDLSSVFSWADIVTVHVPLMEKTRNLITSKELSCMRPESYLVNASRGGILKEDDLAKLLEEKKIAGAALDVFETEPLPQDSKWRRNPSVVLTPHLGASTKEAQQRVSQLAVEVMETYFSKGNHLFEVLPKA